MAATVDEANAIIDDKALVEEDLLDELEDFEIPANIREARLAQLKKTASDFRLMKDKDHGNYSELNAENDFLELTTSEDRCVVHFYHADFRRCAIMDTHLEVLARKHFETKFAKINVDKAKFFVGKLKICVLPAVLCFLKGIVVDRIIGFDEIGNTDDFPTGVLERRLLVSGIIKGHQTDIVPNKNSIFGRSSAKTADDDSDSENDW